MARRALGKGLSSLIPEAPKAPPAGPSESGHRPPDPGLRQLDIDLIRPNPDQPRQGIDPGSIETLATSIRERGVLQPVLVRPVANGRFELVAGERRWRAAQAAGQLKVPAIVKDIPDDRLLEMALIENIQREELNPMDEASAYRTLIDEMGLTQEDVARRVGKQRVTISNMLRLLGLARPVQARVRSGELSMGHARALAGIENLEVQAEVAATVVRQGLSVRQVEALVNRSIRDTTGKAAKRQAPRRDPNVVSAEQDLQRALGTKVRIVQGKNGGRIEIHCFSTDEMNGVYEVLLDAARRRPRRQSVSRPT